MKYPLLLLVSGTLLVGCGAKDATDRGVYYDNGNTIYGEEEVEMFNENQDDDQFGFVRQVKSPVPNETARPIKMMDREEVANAIAQLLVQIPHVDQASVVVTDEEILIAYEVGEEQDKDERFETADQVKKTAMSLIPRWYHIYVTDDPLLRQDVTNIASMSSRSPDKDETVKRTVERMLNNSPQGRDLHDGENANGETTGEVNESLEKNNYKQQMERKENNQ